MDTKMDTEQVLDPTGEDAATISGWSDRHPATIVKRTAKTIWIQEDRVINMTSEANRESGLAFARGHGDVVVFLRDYDSPIRKFTLRVNGRWVANGAPKHAGPRLSIGTRNHYRDPHF
jgi:hypothetical protein